MASEKDPLTIGSKFGELTIVGISRKDKRSRRYYPVLCSCGNTTEVRKDTVVSGRAKSCGCKTQEYRTNALKTHGMTGTYEYHVWENMVQRCTNPKASGYDYYGAIGIGVCDEWRGSFSKFFEEMGLAPKGCSLDRIDVKDGYHKENCRWASTGVQVYNTRRRSDNKSGKTGVTWLKNNKKWLAQIQKEGIVYNLGYYTELCDAVAVREAAELKYYGFNVE